MRRSNGRAHADRLVPRPQGRSKRLFKKETCRGRLTVAQRLARCCARAKVTAPFTAMDQPVLKGRTRGLGGIKPGEPRPMKQESSPCRMRRSVVRGGAQEEATARADLHGRRACGTARRRTHRCDERARKAHRVARADRLDGCVDPPMLRRPNFGCMACPLEGQALPTRSLHRLHDTAKKMETRIEMTETMRSDHRHSAGEARSAPDRETRDRHFAKVVKD